MFTALSCCALQGPEDPLSASGWNAVSVRGGLQCRLAMSTRKLGDNLGHCPARTWEPASLGSARRCSSPAQGMACQPDAELGRQCTSTNTGSGVRFGLPSLTGLGS